MIKKLLFFLFTILMSVNMMAESYILTPLENITDSDIVIVTMDNGSIYAMPNNNGTGSAPTAVSVNILNDTLQTNDSTILWSMAKNDDSFELYPYGISSKWLYCTNSNNGVRVGTNTNKSFIIKDNYMYNSSTGRYIGIYNSQDWRCYTSINANIKNQTLRFYTKAAPKIEPQPVDPPVNLGEKTIAEFLELKNIKDTCILTGVVDSITNTTYGNLYMSDSTAQVFIYGVLTPDGHDKEFNTLDVDINDTLTIKAVYGEYKGKPEAINAVFVEVKKYVEPTPTGLPNIEDKAKGYKVFNGTQILIVKNGKTFNILGQRLD